MAFDAHMAWMGTFAEGRQEQVRVEAASWEGRPVYFNISGDWQLPNAVQAEALALVFLLIVILVGAGLVAWSNIRLGRGDRRGAANLATVAFLMVMCAWAAKTAHVARTWELGLLVMALRRYSGCSTWRSSPTCGGTGRTHSSPGHACNRAVSGTLWSRRMSWRESPSARE